MPKNTTYTLDDLIVKASSYISDEDSLELIKKAYFYARDAHLGQIRKSGVPYINHPLATSIILTTVYADTETICAGLLHDVLEDTNVTKDELEKEFGREITNLVYGVTKISKIHFSTVNEALIEYYKKIIVGMSEDVRVIIIKLADRLHNMRTLWALSEDRRKAISKETLEILAPIASHLGIHKIKSELEDLCLKYLKPDVFYDIAEKLNTTKLERDAVVNEMLQTVSNMLKEHNIKHEIKGRSKSIYSIYKKLEKGRNFSDIYDLLALRILVENEQDCYTIIGLIHSKYRPIPKRFKDYVAMPKSNGYRSLHTTVFGIDGYLFEIQIRTYEMNDVAENGMASHWAYKEKKDLTKEGASKTDMKLQFFRSIIELNEEKMSSEEFVNSVKDEVLNNNIYVFSPKGDVFELPRGSTPIDFAYRIHSKVGDTMIGAIVNNNIVPLDYELKDNDIVKINTSKSSTPSREWLNIAKSTQAKSKIRSFFSKSDKAIYIERGRDALEKELRKKKISIGSFLTEENIKKICEELKTNDLDDIYLNIGNNKFGPTTVISVIIKKEDVTSPDIKPKVIKQGENDIIVAGIDKIQVNVSNCCKPVPGDKIIGYITKNNGISVHRIECHNLEYLDNRMIKVSWDKVTKNKYLTRLIITSKIKDNGMLEIMQKASLCNIAVENIKTLNRSDVISYQIDVWVLNKTHLDNYINSLNNLGYIKSIVRWIG